MAEPVKEDASSADGSDSSPKPPLRRKKSLRRQRAFGIASFVVPLVLILVSVLVLNGTLSLLDPGSGIWVDATTSAWGNQTFQLPGLEHPVTVVRNGAGTVYIYAEDDADLAFAQGYTQASDRLFQMEAQSLVAQGNISRWEGTSGLASDEAFRYLGMPHAAAEIVAGLPTVAPQAYDELESFSDGVNAYIAHAEATYAVPLPFKALGVLPYTWTPYDSVCFERLMVLSQTAGVSEPLLAGLASATVGDAVVNDLYPIYPPDYQNYTVLPGNGSVDNTTLESLQHVNASYVFSQDWSAPWATGIPSSEVPQLAPLYRAAISNLSDPYLPGLGVDATMEGVGSNSWVVAANKTGLNLPLLANDPHLPLQLPSLWVPTELIDPNYDVAGWALAGLPGILIGHDANVAWGLTYSGGATAYDYIETLQGDTYWLNGTWHPLSYQNQTIDVAGGSPVSLSVPWTNNGPLVARIGNLGISVRWDGTGPTWEIVAEFLFDHAVSIHQLESWVEQYWDIPTLNFMMAEHNSTTGENHIGWIIPAHYHLISEVLPDGQSVHVIGARAALNGSGAFEPVGTVPPQLSPQVIDPARGYLYAPNQPSVGQDYPYPMIGGWWDAGGRAHTIGNFLNTHPNMPVANMEALQANVTDTWAVMYSPLLEQALTNLSTTGPAAVQGLAHAALSELEGWNGSFETYEVAPTIYTYWWNEILAAVYTPFLQQLGLTSAVPPDPNELFAVALSDPSNPLFPAGWDSVNTAAASAALKLLAEHFGTGNGAAPDLSGWTWGKVHTLTVPSILGYSSFAKGPTPEWGDGYTPSVAGFSPALTFPLEQSAIGSSLRMVTPPTEGPSWGIIPGGTSGNIGSPYYANQLPLWFAHQYLDLTVVPSAGGPFPLGVVSTWHLNP